MASATDAAPRRERSGLRPFDPRLLARARSVRWVLGADIAAGTAATVLLLAQVTLLATVIAAAAAGEITEVSSGMVAALVVVVALRAGLTHVVELTGRRAASTVMSGLRAELVAHRLHHPQRARGGVDRGELATAAVQGVDGLETYFARYLPQVVLAVTVPAAVVVWSALVDPTSAVIMVLTLPVIPIFMVLIGRSAAARSRANWQALVGLSAHFLDVVAGLPTLRAFNRGRAQIPKIEETTDRYRRTTMGTLRLAFLSGVVLDLATTLSTALVAVTLGVRLVEGSVALRPALTVLLLVPELYAPIRAVGSLFHASTDGLAGAERILEILDTDADTGTGVGVATGVDAGPVGDPAERPVTLQAVSVRYAGRPDPALDAVTLTLAPRELVVVTGPSGAGKSTLAGVLLGTVTPDAGRVLVGNRVRSAADLDRWRHHLAWAPQQPALVHATVAENIALGRPDATADAVAAAARSVGADRFIRDLPAGYDTVIGDGGRGLSAGQRQRLGLARALLRDASLLVLDEPTAHLDPSARALVAAAIAREHGRRTVVVLTHDADLVPGADRALVLTRGRLPGGDPTRPTTGPVPAASSAPPTGGRS